MVVKDIFENVNNWLKFAEAKNGALIALNSALTFGVLRFFINANIEENFYRNIYIYGIVFLLLVSIIIAILSFIPKLEYPYIKFDTPSQNDNLLYFADISKYNDINYTKKIKKIVDKTDNEELEKFYIQQIVINSKITYVKYKQFEVAVWFTLSAFLTPLGALILYGYRNSKI